MFNRVKLTYFRQHEDLEVFFSSGLNVIKGGNEQGKSTCLEAMAYALFGSRSLRESLAETATWGQKETALKVELEMMVNGQTILVNRGKSGAEVRVNGKLEVTGQTETIRFLEGLLGCSAETATNLMLAKQSALRGALESGPGAAVKLIDTLANFSEIDDIIGLVQEHLPTGAVGPADARVATLAAAIGGDIEDNTGELKQTVAVRQHAVEQAKQRREEDETACTKAQAAAQAALSAQAKAEMAATSLQALQGRLTDAEKQLAGITLTPVTADIPILRRAVLNAGLQKEAIAAKAALESAAIEAAWEGDTASLGSAIAAKDEVLESLRKVRAHAQSELMQANAKIIKETHCAFCDKDLTEVPEVASRNAALNEQAATAQQAIENLSSRIAFETQERIELSLVMKAGESADRLYAKYADYITVDSNTVPGTWAWTSDISLNLKSDPTKELAEAEAAQRKFDADSGRKESAELQAHQLKAQVREAKASYSLLKAEAEAGNPAIAEMEELANALAISKGLERGLSQALDLARSELRTAEAVMAERRKSRASAEAALEQAKQDVKDLAVNNELLKRLRSAKPEVADQLWGIVLASVNQHFSAIRGTPSTVTREDNAFKVNGQTIGGLSGSALDSLGLAIRVALTRTFLPNTQFLVLDEPSASCSDEREQNMLGLLVSAGFEQVIIVTHSDAVEAFAQTVIQL